MNKEIKLVVAFAGLILLFCPLRGQDEKPRAVVPGGGIDLVSRYVWRGQDLCPSPSVQPNLSVTWKGFTLGGWGTYSITGDGDQETDFFVSKTLGFVTLTVWDYWTFTRDGANNYFDYRAATTSHLMEAQVLLSGGDKLPFNFLASYFFYGADPTHSVYLELQYVRELSVADLTLFAGYQPKGKFYAENPAFVNLGCTVEKSIAVTDRLSIPLSLSVIVNPAGKSAWLVAAITI